jgi:hypothetical protein
VTHRDYENLASTDAGLDELNTVGQKIVDGLEGRAPEDVADENDIDAAIADGSEVAQELKGEIIDTVMVDSLFDADDDDDDFS